MEDISLTCRCTSSNRHGHGHSQVDQIYALSQQSAMSNTSEDFKRLESVLSDLKPDERVLVSRQSSWHVPERLTLEAGQLRVSGLLDADRICT